MGLFVYRRWHVRHVDRRIRMDRAGRGCDLSRDRGGCSLLAFTLNFGERCRIDDAINGQRSRRRGIVDWLRRRLGPRYRDRRRRLGYRQWPGRVGRRHGWRPRRWNRLWTLSPHAADAPIVFQHRKGKPLWTPPVADLASPRRGSPSRRCSTRARRSRRQAARAAPPHPAGEL